MHNCNSFANPIKNPTWQQLDIAFWQTDRGSNRREVSLKHEVPKLIDKTIMHGLSSRMHYKEDKDCTVGVDIVFIFNFFLTFFFSLARLWPKNLEPSFSLSPHLFWRQFFFPSSLAPTYTHQHQKPRPKQNQYIKYFIHTYKRNI